MADDIPSPSPTKEAHDHHHERRVARAWWVFAAIALFYLWTEHQAHLFGVLPYLFVLACPLMHFFMHRHHGGHRHGAGEENKK